jgi:LPXTG-motif cell wall-anchored protein
VAPAGGSVTVAGDGYRPSSSVHLTLGSASLGRVTTDASGSFTQAVTIPASTAPGAYDLAASGLDADGGPLVQSASLQVTAPGEAVAPPAGIANGNPAVSGQLPRTGNSDTVPMTLVAVSLLAAGAAFVAIARHQRDRERR